MWKRYLSPVVSPSPSTLLCKIIRPPRRQRRKELSSKGIAASSGGKSRLAETGRASSEFSGGLEKAGTKGREFGGAPFLCRRPSTNRPSTFGVARFQTTRVPLQLVPRLPTHLP